MFIRNHADLFIVRSDVRIFKALLFGPFAQALLLLSVLLVHQTAHAQVEGWTSHTSMRQIRAIDASKTHIWSATSGGVFSYDIDTGEIAVFTVVDGLHNVDVRTIGVDPARESVWIGYGDGVFDRIHVPSREITSFRDIERATQFASRGINRIVIHNDSLLFATQFGIVVFDPARSEVRDAYTRLGDNPPATDIFDVVIGPDESGVTHMWAATVDGVARAPLNTVNLQDPTSWTVERSGFLPESETVFSLAVFDGSLFAGTESDAYRRNSDGSYLPLSVTSRAVTDFNVSTDIMLGVERFRLLLFEPGGNYRSVGVDGFQDPVGVVADSDVGFWFGDATRGLASIPRPELINSLIEAQFTVIPSGPFDGLFSDLDVDSDGNIWAGGVAGSATGFYELSKEGEWKTYSSVFFPELDGKNRFKRIHVDNLGTAWAGSEGSGVASASPDGELQVYDRDNSSLLPAVGDDFIIVGGIGSSKNGTVWITTRGTSSPFHARMPDGTWLGFGPYVGTGLTTRSTAYGQVFVDSFDQKWILVRDENNFQKTRGLLVVDTGVTDSQQDDIFQFFGEKGGAGQGLPSRTVLSVTEDRDGLVWLGTDSGPAYFVNSGIVAADPSARAIWPQWADRSQGTFMLFGLRINDVAVDPANQLWFATDDGAWLIRAIEGGYETVHHFTADNSPLFSDEVLSVVVAGDTGEVYFSTSLGLVSYAGDATTPSPKVKDLFVYPNPARFSASSAPDIFIEGLVEETDIRILTATGSLVRKLTARGGRARWDGRDETGSLVSSGVYLVVAVGSQGNGTAHGKVAVIR